jgi:hypothetical protein
MIAAGFFGEHTGIAGPTDPFFANVVLLLPMESPEIVDRSNSPAIITGSGGAAIDTTRYPSGALLLNGTTTGSRKSTNRNCAIGTGPFTFEAYVRPTAAQLGRIINTQDSSAPNAVVAYRVNADGGLTSIIRAADGSGVQVLTTAGGFIAMDDTTLHHVALTRDSSDNVTLWIDGVARATGVSATNVNGGLPYRIGAFDDTQELYAGIIRWVRVTESVCRYTGTFTPPSIPFPLS